MLYFYYGNSTSRKGAKGQASKKFLEKGHELDNANIAYVSFPYLDVLTHDQSTTSPSGTDWDGTVADILRIRCDGTVEVAYEDAGVPLYGADTWWNIMSPGTGSNLALHNDGPDSINPNRQRDGINAAHDLTRNRPDALHLP